MTGFGRASVSAGGWTVQAEARSVNQKGLTVALALPDALSQLDLEMREAVRSRFSRGRIDLRVALTRPSGEAEAPVDMARAGALHRAAREMAARLGIETGLTSADLLRMPGVLAASVSDGPGPEEVMSCVGECLDSLAESRRAEGESLGAIFRTRLQRLSELSSTLAEARQGAVEARFARLRERVARLLESPPDEARMAQELALISDRLDISEELERLALHITSALALTASEEPDSGRRLGFLLQEVQREVNTLGAKIESPAGLMQVVEMKNEVASMREQAANVE
jgi:uncharacterized protein (TIGR00255 family)